MALPGARGGLTTRRGRHGQCGKVAAIAQAQDAGRVSNRFPAAELLVLVVGLATMGATELAPAPDPALRRRTVTQAVELLTKDEA